VQFKFSDTVEKGMVISSDPGGGSRVPHSRRISVVVSKGKDVVTIPTVAVGSTPDNAKALLGTVPIEFNPVTTSKPSDTVKAGLVLGTDPPGGTSVKRDSEVTLIVSSGPPILSVPDVTGEDDKTATKDLKAAGFKVKSTEDYSSVVDTGKVITQDPPGNSQLAKFQTVTITVSKGHAPVVIPPIPSLTPVDDATATLEAAGLQVKVNYVYGGLLKKVLGMSPAAGTTVPYGSTVVIDVA